MNEKAFKGAEARVIPTNGGIASVRRRQKALEREQ